MILPPLSLLHCSVEGVEATDGAAVVAVVVLGVVVVTIVVDVSVVTIGIIGIEICPLYSIAFTFGFLHTLT